MNPTISKFDQQSLRGAVSAMGYGTAKRYIVIVVLLSFLLMLWAISSHHHSNGLESRDCAICVLSVQKYSGAPKIVFPTAVMFVFVFLEFKRRSYINKHLNFLPTPPSCGPPCQS